MGGIPACRSNSQRGSQPANHVALTANLLHGCFCVWHDTRALKYPHRTRELSCWSPCLATRTLYRRSVDDVTMTSPRDHGHNPRRAPDSPHMIYYTLPQTSCTWALMTPPPPGGPRTHNGQNVHCAPRTSFAPRLNQSKWCMRGHTRALPSGWLICLRCAVKVICSKKFPPTLRVCLHYGPPNPIDNQCHSRTHQQNTSPRYTKGKYYFSLSTVCVGGG